MDYSQGVIWANAYETLKLDSKNVTIDGKQSCKIMTSGLMTIRGVLVYVITIIEESLHCLKKTTEPAQMNKE